MLQRQVPVLIAFLGGFIMLLDYFFDYPIIGWTRENLSNWARIGFTFAAFLGIINLIQVNLKKTLRLAPGWGYNLTLLLALFATMGFGFFEKGGVEGPTSRWFFNNFYTPCTATMFGLLAFFIASAAFRAFRAKNIEATLLLVTAAIVMLGNIPLGDLIAEKLLPFLPYAKLLPESVRNALLPSTVQNWIQTVFVTAGQRAIVMGAAVGLVAVSIKILAGIDRSYFGGE